MTTIRTSAALIASALVLGFVLVILLRTSGGYAEPQGASGSEVSSPPGEPDEQVAPAVSEQPQPQSEAAPGERAGKVGEASEGAGQQGESAAADRRPGTEDRRPDTEGSPDASEDFRGLSKEEIDAGVRDQMPDILHCYQGWLNRNPELEGTLVVEFVIGVDEEDPDLGRVQEIDIADTSLGHLWMEGCVLHVMEDAEFDAPRGGGVMRVRYPFEFSSDED